ncbi:MAG: dTMP kinase [Variibacter sp.]
MRGRFITFEGGEGTGKSTQAAFLAQRLENAGFEVVVTREPGGSPGAEAIRHVLLSGAAKPLGPDVEAMLFSAARDDHVRSLIVPALEAGRWVICDRFIDSTRVYQGVLGHVDMRLINALERIALAGLNPDLTIILDADPNVGLTRAQHRRGAGAVDRFEAEAIEFHEELRSAYRVLARREPERCIVIEATGTKTEVSDRIWDAVSGRLGLAWALGRIEDLPT